MCSSSFSFGIYNVIFIENSHLQNPLSIHSRRNSVNRGGSKSFVMVFHGLWLAVDVHRLMLMMIRNFSPIRYDNRGRNNSELQLQLFGSVILLGVFLLKTIGYLRGKPQSVGNIIASSAMKLAF